MADGTHNPATYGAVAIFPDVPQAVVKEPPQEHENESVMEDEKVPDSGSFKEESTRVVDLLENEKKALEKLKQLVQKDLNKPEFQNKQVVQEVVVANEAANEETKDEVPVTKESPKPQTVVETNDEPVKEESSIPVETVEDDGAKTVEAIEESIVSVQQQEQPAQAAKEESEEAKEITIWGVPLLADERTDVILLKFLRARDFKVKEAFTMLKNTIRWRKEFGIDELAEQDLSDDDELKKVVFMHGFDKEGHPVCYNVFGEFQNKELYQKTFSDEDKRQTFLRWRIQFLEKSIRKLDFSPGGICTIVQVNDLSHGPAKWELRQATKQALQLFQDNYPEFVARQVFINVPWWYLAVNKMINPFLTQRTKSKFVFASPSKSAETLFRYIGAEQVPVEYGGLSKEGEFSTSDAVTEITVKPAVKHTVEFPVTEACSVTWEVRVVGWGVSYGAEFVPSAENSYTVIIQKARKVNSDEEAVVCDNFKIGEAGKLVLTVHNPTSKKKKLLYRLKTNTTSGQKE